MSVAGTYLHGETHRPVMTMDPSDPLEGIAPESISPRDIDESKVHAALSAPNPTVRRRGMDVCLTLAKSDIDAVRPFLDDIAPLAGDDNAVVALRAIAILGTVSHSEPAALEGRLSGLVGALDTDIVDVQLNSGPVFRKLAIERPDLLVPHTRQLIEAIRGTEFDREIRDFGDVIDDRVTRQTLQTHEMGERRRRVASRRTLINVVVALVENNPRSMRDIVVDLLTLLDDVDPAITSGAVAALGQLAATEPDAVAPVSDRVIDCLDHDRSAVRARAIWALGHLGDDAAVSKLQTIAETDDDDEIRNIANETANFLTNT